MNQPSPQSNRPPAKANGWFGKVVPILLVIGIAAYVLATSRSGGPTAPNAQTPTPGPSAETPQASASAPAASAATPPAKSLPNLNPASQPSRPAEARTTAPTSSPAPTASGPTATPGAAGPAPTSIKIGAWNIEWLGKPEDRAQFAKNVAQDPAVMADYIVGSGVSVLGVAEIVTQIPGRPIRSRELEAAIDAIRGKTNQRWEYALNPGRADGDQLTGLMWNTAAVTALNQSGQKWDQQKDLPWRVPVRDARSSQGSRLWNRPPHAIKFRAGGPSDTSSSDFIVVVLHMKADYQGDFAKHRQEEMDALIDALPAVRKQFGDDDIILVGDTNVTSPGEAMIKDLTAAGYADLNAANITTTWRDGFTDRAFVPATQPEFVSKQFWVFSDDFLRARRWKPGDFKKNLSDHYMVGTVLRVQNDDD
jgi:hypothetical protein